MVSEDSFSGLGNEAPREDAELELISRFLQGLQDWGDILGDVDIGDRVKAEHSVSASVHELQAAGWNVLGRKAQRLVGFHVGPKEELPVSLVFVARIGTRQVIELGDGRYLVIPEPRSPVADEGSAEESTGYIDDGARYLGGHPRYTEIGDGTITLEDELIRFDCTDQRMSVRIPGADIAHVYSETQHLGMEQAEAEDEVLIGDHETLLRSTAVINVKDRESVRPEGFKVRFGFRNEYYAELFTKKCSERFRVPPF